MRGCATVENKSSMDTTGCCDEQGFKSKPNQMGKKTAFALHCSLSFLGTFGFGTIYRIVNPDPNSLDAFGAGLFGSLFYTIRKGREAAFNKISELRQSRSQSSSESSSVSSSFSESSKLGSLKRIICIPTTPKFVAVEIVKATFDAGLAYLLTSLTCYALKSPHKLNTTDWTILTSASAAAVLSFAGLAKLAELGFGDQISLYVKVGSEKITTNASKLSAKVMHCASSIRRPSTAAKIRLLAKVLQDPRKMSPKEQAAYQKQYVKKRAEIERLEEQKKEAEEIRDLLDILVTNRELRSYEPVDLTARYNELIGKTSHSSVEQKKKTD